MSDRLRWSAALLAVAVLAGLLVWQRGRSRVIAECVAGGGAWNGPTSRCVPLPGPPLLQRDLRRS